MFAKKELLAIKKITFAGQALAQYKKDNIAMNQTKILIGLSIVGNPHCTGNDLFAIAEHAINNHKETIFLIGDEVHWHNLKNEYTTAEQIPALKEQAMQLGSIYLNDNLPVFLNVIKKKIPTFNIELFHQNHLSMDEKINAINALGLFTIIRWHDWVAHETYSQKQTEIMACYESDPTLKKDLETSVNDYIQRQHKKPESNLAAITNQQLLKIRALGYIKEESPALFWIPAALGIDFVAYPGKRTKVFESTRNYFVEEPTKAPHSLRIETENSHRMANWIQISVKNKHRKAESQDGSIRFFSTTPSQSSRLTPLRSQSCNDISSETVVAEDKISSNNSIKESNSELVSTSPPSVDGLLRFLHLQAPSPYEQRRLLEAALRELSLSRDTRTPVPPRGLEEQSDDEEAFDVKAPQR